MSNPTRAAYAFSDAAAILQAAVDGDTEALVLAAQTEDASALLVSVAQLTAMALAADAASIECHPGELTPALSLLAAAQRHAHRSAGVSDDQGGHSE